MFKYKKILIALSLFFLISCSASYDKLSKGSFEPNDDFSKFLLKNYKQKADFEAKEMHDWDSAKLYSEKALAAVDGAKILPQKISYWKIPEDKKNDLVKAYNDIIKIYVEATVSNPFYLAKAISSLDCWSEQQEENWQTWDIDQCRDDYIYSMHKIYNIIDKKKDSLYSNSIKENIIHKNIKQIVYFDFNESKLTPINKAEITNFIFLDKDLIKKYIVIGHTDTKGNKKYNYNLSLDRAEQVKKLLVSLNIKKENIIILGKGEDDLKILTEDGIKHTANRRAEISPLNQLHLSSVLVYEYLTIYMYTKTTKKISITVNPYFLEDQSEPDEQHYVWAYQVTINNLSKQSVQLKNRYWKIIDSNGSKQEVKGEGVVGEQPILNPGEKFEYTSGTPLSTPSGFMEGYYEMETKSGLRFEANIPQFSLDSPFTSNELN